MAIVTFCRVDKVDVREHAAEVMAGGVGVAWLEPDVESRRETILPLDRDLDEIRVVSRHQEDAEFLASVHPRARPVADVRDAVEGADVVCLATHAAQPVFDAAWVAPGTHVSSVGYHPPVGELPRGLLVGTHVVVEDEVALQAPPVGASDLAGVEEVVTLGAVLEGTAPGRTAADQITVYKAMGVGRMVAANLAYEAAVRAEAGTVATD